MPIKETFDSKKYMLNKKLKDAKKNTPKDEDEDDAEVVNKGGKKDIYEGIKSCKGCGEKRTLDRDGICHQCWQDKKDSGVNEEKSIADMDSDLEGRMERNAIAKSDTPYGKYGKYDRDSKTKKKVKEYHIPLSSTDSNCGESEDTNKDVSERKRPIFEKYQALHESKTSEQISRSLGYLLSIAGDAKQLHSGIKQSEPMLNEKLIKKLTAVLHVISKIKNGQAPNEAPAKSDTKDTEDKGDK